MIKKLERAFYNFMQEMELNMNDASLKDTPKRVAKMFMTETCK